jgi:hypothetical protein
MAEQDNNSSAPDARERIARRVIGACKGYGGACLRAAGRPGRRQGPDGSLKVWTRSALAAEVLEVAGLQNVDRRRVRPCLCPWP